MSMPQHLPASQAREKLLPYIIPQKEMKGKKKKCCKKYKKGKRCDSCPLRHCA